MIHSSLDDQIIFEITQDNPWRCPDRVVISDELLREPLAGEHAGKITPEKTGVSIDTFIQGYLEGCVAARSVR